MPEFTEFRIEHGSRVITGIERSGDGIPILLLHGVGGNALCFKPLMSALNGRRVIAFDMPGHGGNTDAPSWGMDSRAGFLFSVCRHLGKGPFGWGGRAWGANMATTVPSLH